MTPNFHAIHIDGDIFIMARKALKMVEIRHFRFSKKWTKSS